MAGSHFEQRAVNVNREGSPPPSPATCETEDHGFANHKPGSAGGLFGAATVKHAIQDTCDLPCPGMLWMCANWGFAGFMVKADRLAEVGI